MQYCQLAIIVVVVLVIVVVVVVVAVYSSSSSISRIKAQYRRIFRDVIVYILLH